MYCTFTEAIKCLGFKSRNSLYQLEKKGALLPYLSTINCQKYLYMKEIKVKTLAQHIRNHLTSNNWIEVNDYDLHLYVELANGG